MRRLIGGLLAAVVLAACAEAPAPRTAAQSPPPTARQRVAHAQMLQHSSGVYYVDVALAGLCCFKMMLDTGASDVSVPISLWYAMLKDGVITEEDHFAVASYRTANGVVEGLRFRMPPMTIAGVTVHDVTGSVTTGDTGKTILLGQSFLTKFKAWQINNATGQLILAY